MQHKLHLFLYHPVVRTTPTHFHRVQHCLLVQKNRNSTSEYEAYSPAMGQGTSKKGCRWLPLVETGPLVSVHQGF
jgi:hypothetical protein